MPTSRRKEKTADQLSWPICAAKDVAKRKPRRLSDTFKPESTETEKCNMASFPYTSAPPYDSVAVAQGQDDPPSYQEVLAADSQSGPELPQYGPSGYLYTMGQPFSIQPGQHCPGHLYRGRYSRQVPLVQDYLCYSVFTMMCCCMPLGIAALSYSLITREAYRNGDHEKAERNSRKARILNHVALGCGITIIMLPIVTFAVIVFMLTGGIYIFR